MNLKEIKDSFESDNIIEVGNENSYAKCINKVNFVEKTELQVSDFKTLETMFALGTKLSYKVSEKQSKNSVLTLSINDNLLINIFKI